MIIYKTTNKKNGKIYVGQDSKNNPNYLGSGRILLLAIKKYGISNFEKEILEACASQLELNSREIYWIDHLRSYDRKIGYNIALGGTGGDTYSNNPNKERWRIKNSLAMKGKPNKHSSATKQKISESVKLSWKENPDQGTTGKKHTAEAKRKISLSKTGMIVEKKKCNRCGRLVDPGNYRKYHGDLCKNKPCLYCAQIVGPTIYARYHGEKCEKFSDTYFIYNMVYT